VNYLERVGAAYVPLQEAKATRTACHKHLQWVFCRKRSECDRDYRKYPTPGWVGGRSQPLGYG